MPGMARCYHCQTALTLSGKPARSDECPVCGRDLRVCLNCRHYDPGAYRGCREPVAEEVRDKDRGNFCDWFQFRPDGPGQTGAPGQPGTKNRKAFDSLFGES